jgi:Kef-type K+ transport system membrane component KefB
LAYDIIAQILVVLAVAVMAGEIFEQLDLPSVAGELLAGLVLGPAMLGIVRANQQTEAVSTVSLFFIIFLIGLDNTTRILRQQLKRAILASTTSFFVPLLVVAVTALLILPFGIVANLALALAIATPSMSIVSVLVWQYRLLDKEAGRVILASVTLSDVAAFILLVAISQTMSSTISTLGYTAAFFVVYLIADYYIRTRSAKFKSFLRRLSKKFRRDEIAFAIFIVLGLAVSSIFQIIGIGYIIGAFFAGLIVHEALIGEKAAVRISTALARINSAFFIPLFFGLAGTEVMIDSSGYGVLPSLALIVAVCLIPSFVLTYYATKRIMRIRGHDSPRMVAGVLGGRGAVGIVIASIALSEGIMNSLAYAMVLLETLAVSLLVPFILGRIQHD